jgi:hypothetical protein
MKRGRAVPRPHESRGRSFHRRSDSGRAASTVARPEAGHGDPDTPDSSRSSSSATRLAAGSELGDELLSLVQLAAEPVPLLGCPLWERLARVAGVELADRGDALPLPGPELAYRRRLLRLAPSAFPSRPHECHDPGTRGAGRHSGGPARKCSEAFCPALVHGECLQGGSGAFADRRDRRRRVLVRDEDEAPGHQPRPAPPFGRYSVADSSRRCARPPASAPPHVA